MPYIAIKFDRRIPKGNCEKWGQAARAIGDLLWEDKNLFTEFREAIEKLHLTKILQCVLLRYMFYGLHIISNGNGQRRNYKNL